MTLLNKSQCMIHPTTLFSIATAAKTLLLHMHTHTYMYNHKRKANPLLFPNDVAKNLGHMQGK